MAVFEIHAEDAPIRELAQSLAVAGKRLPNAAALVMNRVVTRARPKVVKAVAAETGIFPKILTKAVRPLRASPTNLRAGLASRGGEIGLRYFKAREANGGVAADVAGEREFFPGAFRRSGRAPNRYMVRRLNKQVYVRDTESRRWGAKPIVKQGSGVWIPLKMIEGESRKAFDEVAATELPVQIARELDKILGARGR